MLEGKVLLVVDDEENAASALSETLRREGFNVEVAVGGEEAILLVQESEFDLVLAGLHFKTVGGLSVPDEIRRLHPLTVVIVLTGFACNVEDLKTTIRRGLKHRRLLLDELERRVEEQTRQLRTANQELSGEGAAKDVLLATIAHEVRTPLTPIVGWVRVLLGNPTAEVMQKGLQVIERNALQQAKLIEDLLDISRVITGTLTFTPEVLDLRKAAESAADSVREKAIQKEIHLAVKVPNAPVMVRGVRMRLEQTFVNLLSNAITFTGSGGTVTLLVKAMDSETNVSVIDTGVGITPEFLPYVFERLKRADWLQRRKHAGVGLGLGLAIVDRLVELHDGSVSVDSQGIGAGSTFTVTLPLATPLPQQTESGPGLDNSALVRFVNEPSG